MGPDTQGPPQGKKVPEGSATCNILIKMQEDFESNACFLSTPTDHRQNRQGGARPSHSKTSSYGRIVCARKKVFY
ncbi:MAG: hypothetical protein C0514_07775 [Candidatus Puniceispirillum sp.]|nr:hypothetical protein [Candidatus Puniceispirillum sp.]